LDVNWDQIYPEILDKSKGFDFIVGNPPYVRIQDLNENLREKLLKRWCTISEGNFNIYFAFIELGMRVLKKTGKLGYITPNNYFTSLAAIELRKYLHSSKNVSRIINFNHLKIFNNAQTYTSIIFMEKNYKLDYFQYCYLDEIRAGDIDLKGLKFSNYFYKWLDDKKWRLMTEEDFDNIKKCESTGIPLGKLCKIRVGFATLKDPIFFVTEYDENYCITNFNGLEVLIEKGITRKAIKIPDIKNESDIESNSRRIIFPYIKKSTKYEIMSEEFLKVKFPKWYDYFLAVKSELSNRDKGKKSYPNWFAWGRSQGMDFKGPRLYTKTFSKEPNFLLDNEDNLFCNGYAVFPDNHIKAIQRVLNSKVMEYYTKKTSYEIEGNYQCYQKNFIERFNIPYFSNDEWKLLEQESEKRAIDAFLMKKYDLILNH
jgi:adenine-specific DNA-methyltransferase